MILLCEAREASLQRWKQADSWLGVRLRTWDSSGAMARLVVTYTICLSKLTDATLKMGTFYIQIIPRCWLKTKWKKSQRWPDFAEGPQHERIERTWKNREPAESKRQGQRKYTSKKWYAAQSLFLFLILPDGWGDVGQGWKCAHTLLWDLDWHHSL